MKDTKLLRALSTLNKEEWMSFRKYLLMHTGVESEIFSLFKIVQSKKSNFEGLKNPDRFRNKHFADLSQKAFFVMLSKLYKWFEEWLSYYEFKTSDYQQELFLIKSLLKKGLLREGKSHAEKLKNKIQKEKSLHFDQHKILGQIDHLIYYGNADGIQMNRHKQLISASELCAKAYKEQSQFYMAELMNRSYIFTHDFTKTIDLLDQSIANIPNTELCLIGSSLINAIQHKDIDHLNKLLKIVIGNKIKIDSELELTLVSYLSIYLRRFHSSGIPLDKDLYYSLIEFQFEKSMKRTGGKITQVAFHNTVDAVGNILSFEHAQKFIEEYIDKVDTKNPKEAKDLAFSQIYFINRDFKKMFEYSRFTAFDLIGDKTRSWLHNVICQFVFRKENYDGVKQSLVAFKNYLKRNKKRYSKNFFQSNFNTATILQKIIKNDFKPQEINLDEYKVIFYRKWITEEVQKIKGK